MAIVENGSTETKVKSRAAGRSTSYDLSDISEENIPNDREYEAPLEVSLLDLAILLSARRSFLLRVTLAIACIAAIVAFIMPNKYTATAVILPPQQGASSGAALLAQLGNGSPLMSLASGSMGLKNPNDLQVAMLRSRTVEDAMLDRFHLASRYHDRLRSEARKDFEKSTDIDNGIKDGLIRISVTDKDPVQAANIANGYVAEYKQFSATIAVTEASQRRLFFEQQLLQAKDSLANSEEALKETEQKTGLIELEGQARAVIESVAQLRAQVAAKEVQIRAIREFATDQNPDLQRAQQELDGLQSQLTQMGADQDGSAGDLLMPKGTVPQASLDYARKLRDVKYNETIFELLAKQYEAAKIDEAKEGSIIQVVDPAIAPDKKSSPQRPLIIGGAAVVAFVVVCLWALCLEAWRLARSDPAIQKRWRALRASAELS